MSQEKKDLLESLHQQFYPMVFQMCLGFAKGYHDLAEDLSQEVMINVWNGLEKYNHQSAYKTWIYRITVNTCLQYIRSQKNKQSLLPLNNEPSEKTIPPSSEGNQAHRGLYQAIGQLAEVDRLIIMMVLEEQAYEEIADVMGINPVNLRVKIHRIKKRLKKILEDGK